MPRYIDRSRIEADWVCPRKRYWNYEFQAPGTKSRGIVRVEDHTALIFGTAMHSALSGLMLDVNTPQELALILEEEIKNKLSYLQPQQLLEYRNLSLGLFWGYATYILPVILNKYDVIAIEQECQLPINYEVIMLCRPDLCLQRKSDGTIWYPDFKTTGYNTPQWAESWQYSIQQHTGCLAIEQTLKMPVEGAMIIGLYKGFTDRTGKLRSPFTYAYYNSQADCWKLEYTRGWELLSVDQAGDIGKWLDMLGSDTVKEQFPIVEEIAVNREMLKNFLQQQAWREDEVTRYLENKAYLNEVFPQHFKSCKPAFGPACPYIDCCFVPAVTVDPVGSKLYVIREPHHVTEAMELANAK